MPDLLEQINQPADLKELTHEQLCQLASEIRTVLIQTVSNNGGHLASNLGVVELTLALHRVFDSPRDKIVWDVGHQSYTHKLLTGRRARFQSLRQYQGLSGFCDPEESEHDSFVSGHASTSVSIALGMAKARDLSGDDYTVVAVIGDGALTGGMAFEALNQAGHLGTSLTVVLNDNRMSISPTVGAMSKLLDRLWFDRRYEMAEQKAKRFLLTFRLGRRIWILANRLRNSLKRFFLPASIWEELGFRYMGPFDGHDIVRLEKALVKSRQLKAPVFIHVVTTKGKGHPPSEEDAVRFHGISAAGAKIRTAPTYSKVFAGTLIEMMRHDSRIVAITPAMAEGSGLDIVADEFPDRVFDVGICEQHAVTFAAGMAARGLLPVVAIYSTFLQRAIDQVIHDVCIPDLPVVFALDRSGIVGDDGKSHQGLLDISYLTMIPNMIVSAPKDEDELRHLLFTAIGAGHPMSIRYPRGAGVGVSLESPLKQLGIGKSEVLCRGRDVVLIAFGSTVAPTMEAASQMALSGIESTVINARFAKPLDTEVIFRECLSSRRVVTIEENVLAGGIGNAILQAAQREGLTGINIRSIGIPDQFVEHGSQSLLRSKYSLDAQGISTQVLAFFPELAARGVKKTAGDTITVVAAMTEARDPYTAGHQRRVASLACAIAVQLGLPSQRVEGIRIAGLVHDIGKISVPSDVLSKPGRLTEAEFSIVHKHAEAGSDILKPVDFPWPIAQTVLQHHMRLDGSGYPPRSNGTEIILEARILAVADVVEAMASHRPYRAALGIDSALAEISSNRGTLYDPLVVDACLKLFKEHGFTFT